MKKGKNKILFVLLCFSNVMLGQMQTKTDTILCLGKNVIVKYPSISRTHIVNYEEGYFKTINATRWDEGTPAQEIKDASGNVIGAKASLKAFMVGGKNQTPTDASNVEYWWHTHPKTSVGGLQLGNSNPSPADFSFQTTMESRGFKGNTFVIGVRSGTVTFYNKDKALITVKYADFKTMGGK